ncbi:MAG: hypothetical protein HY530_06600 [Chloroflexi bacterium]|nr:hypothetical protein [Chloroflexota bacterium]
MDDKIDFQPGCKATAMGIMPHADVGKALELALSLDVPFWPQLPNVSFYEDMYVQTSENFPGIVVDMEEKKLTFSAARFAREVEDYSRRMAEPETFMLSESYSAVYRSFLARDLGRYPAIRGQVTGPVSFGFRVTDEELRPIIYNDEVRTLLFDFIQRKVNTQYRQLKQSNRNAFVWLDEPGLGWVFSGLSGYSDVQCREDYQNLLAGLEGPRALHLCANVNLPYLLGLGVQLVSFDAYQMGLMPRGYASAVAGFIRDGGIIAWGIVPTDPEGLAKETPESLARLLVDYWRVVFESTGLPVLTIAGRSLVAPARCCLKNVGRVGASGETASAEICPALTTEEEMVERAFACLKGLSEILKDEFRL